MTADHLLTPYRLGHLTLRNRITQAAGVIDGDMGDPGFEPGTSSLSERRSNRLS